MGSGSHGADLVDDLAPVLGRSPVPADLDWIDDALDEWPCTLRWDVRGHTPSAPSLASRLWDDVAAQRVILDERGAPVGLVQLTAVNWLNGTGRLEGIVRDPVAIAGSVGGFARRLFADFPLRMLHIFAVVDVLTTASLLPAASEVGRLVECHFRGLGRYEDITIHELRPWRSAT